MYLTKNCIGSTLSADMGRFPIVECRVDLLHPLAAHARVPTITEAFLFLDSNTNTIVFSDFNVLPLKKF